MKKMTALLLALLLGVTLLFTGCGEKPVEPDYSALIQDPLDRQLEDLLDAATLQSLIGYEWELLGVYENGTQLLFSAGEGEQVTVNMMNTTRTDFDERMTAMEGLEAEPDLGEGSWWYGANRELMTYGEGYAISVIVILSDDVHPRSLARRVTEHILKQL